MRSGYSESNRTAGKSSDKMGGFSLCLKDMQ